MVIKAFAMVYLNSQLEESFEHNKAEVLQCHRAPSVFQSEWRQESWVANLREVSLLVLSIP